jgi:hypothetical protein
MDGMMIWENAKTWVECIYYIVLFLNFVNYWDKHINTFTNTIMGVNISEQRRTKKCQKSLVWGTRKKQCFPPKFVALWPIDFGLALAIMFYLTLFAVKIWAQTVEVKIVFLRGEGLCATTVYVCLKTIRVALDRYINRRSLWIRNLTKTLYIIIIERFF